MKALSNAAERLAKGSGTLGLRIGRGITEWLKAGKTVGDFLIRIAFLALPLWILWTLVMAARSLLWLVAAIWCIAAYRAVPGPAKSEAGADGLDRDDVVELLWELTGDRRGVHLATIAEQLTRETADRNWSVADVRKLLKAVEIPTRHSVRVSGIGVAVGVHRQDLPGSPSPTASERSRGGVERQLRAATATATRPTVEDVGGGAVRVIRHPGERRQYDVRPEPEEVES